MPEFRAAATTASAQERVDSRGRKARNLIQQAAVIMDEIDQILTAEGVTGHRRNEHHRDIREMMDSLSALSREAYYTGSAASSMIFEHRGSDAPPRPAPRECSHSNCDEWCDHPSRGSYRPDGTFIAHTAS